MSNPIISIKPGCLYIVATPIGNLEDITFRGLKTLASVTCIVSEDTRHTRKLLAAFDIHTPLVSYFKGKEREKIPLILEKLRQGGDVALVSDAGTPCLSDPGSLLVQEARKQHIPIIPIPGASALTAAISVAGFTDSSFFFFGFLPGNRQQRKKNIQNFADFSMPVMLYESPKRLIACLKDCLQILGNRDVFIGREMTKVYEEYFSGPLVEIISQLEDKSIVKGECVILLKGCEQPETVVDDDVEALLYWYRDKSTLSLKDSVRKISVDLNLKRSDVYGQALEIWKNNG